MTKTRKPKNSRAKRSLMTKISGWLSAGPDKFRNYWQAGGWWRKLWLTLMMAVILFVGSMYGIARWYIASQADKPLKYGVTFIAPYAQHFGLDPRETLQAMIDDLGIRQIRLVSYWNMHEPEPDVYDFSELDWQFEMAEAAGAKVSLAVGLRQPRWPECHMPKWAEHMPMSQWSEELKDYMRVTIERYKDSPALESYQLENEFFLSVFGECPDFTRERLVDEFNLIKELDPNRPVIVSRSNNAIGLPIGEPRPDVSGVSVYKRVWDKTITRRYFEYPFPAWFYANLAGAGKIVTGRDIIIHELQAEPWMADGFAINDPAHIEEQNKSMNADRLRDRIEYGRATGIKEIYLWGAEWWYWRKVVADDPSLWDVAREEIHRAIETEANTN